MNFFPALRAYLGLTSNLLRSLPFLLASALQLSAASYFVDFSGGVDSNAGTSTTTAWKHCPGDPAATGVAAATSLVPGDTVFFKGGVSYVLTGSSGIALRWNGLSGQPITYDGNSSGAWGTGRAQITDSHGSAALTAFVTSTPASNLAFKNIEFAAIGGAASLPADSGSPVAPKLGGAFAFTAGASATTIDGCVFRDLGYAFNQKPMSAASLAGTAITLRGATNVTISNCDFSRLTVGIDLSGSSAFSGLKIASCTFHDAVVWPFDASANTAYGVEISNCSETNNTQFARTSWTGYGESPRVTTRAAMAGESVTLAASAAATPSAAFQWQKDGQAIGGAINQTLTLPAVALSDAGVYTVVATNSAGSAVSHEVVLNITGGTTTPPPTTTPSGSAPVITTHPISQTVAPMGTVSLTVAASGSPAPTFQWFRNGVTFSGWTGSTLTLVGITSNDVGSYTAVATNSAGSATSNPATLTIGTTSTPLPSEPSTSAPVITKHPVSQTAAVSSTVTFTVEATGSPAPTYQWFRNGITFHGWTGSTLTLPSLTSNDVGTYHAVATNSAGSVTSNPATLTVGTTPPPPPPPSTSAPVITTHPVSQTVTASGNVTFTVAASGSPTPTFQWLRNGSALSGATNSTLALTNVSSANAGSYAAVATNSAGSATSNAATLTVNAAPTEPTGIAPVITVQPTDQTVERRSTATFTVGATGTPAPTYRWFRNGTTFPGWTSATLVLPGITANDVGTYTVVVTNSAGSVTSRGATLSLSSNKGSKLTTAAMETGNFATSAPLAGSRLVNLSVRSAAGIGDSSLIVGFVVDGGSHKSLLIRGSGPALTAFGVPGVLADPTLSLYSGTSLLASNDDWHASTDVGGIAPTSARAGAFLLAEESRDAALLADVAPGAYTGQVSGKDQTSGIALIELYDTATDTDARLVNVSVRTTVNATGEAPVIGFVVAGTEPKRLLVRAIGPTLAGFGLGDVLADPQLEIYADGTRVQHNDNWAGSAELADAFGRVGAFPLADTASKDAAVIVTAAPGAYTAVITGLNGTSGTVLVEVYELP